MIDHISTYAMDYPVSKAFYDAVMEALGYSLDREMVASWDAEFPERRICAWGPGHTRISDEEIDGEKARSSVFADLFVRSGFRTGYRGLEAERIPAGESGGVPDLR